MSIIDSVGNALSTRVFVANTPSTLALPTFRGAGPNVPGFGFDQENNNRLIVVQDVHAFSASLFNEARIGYAANRNYIVPQQPLTGFRPRDQALYRTRRFPACH